MDLLNIGGVGLLVVILGFGFIILVHELGHFLVAKWVGIRCPQFSIGMGHALVAWRKGIGLRWRGTEKEFFRRVNEWLLAQGETPAKSVEGQPPEFSPAQYDRATAALGLGETEYRLGTLPIGGYVKMLGQDDLDATAAASDPRSYSAKPIWARSCVISAGVVMNIIFGFLFFLIAFSAGVRFPSARIGPMDDNSLAANVYAVGHEGDPAYRGTRLGDNIKAIDGETIMDKTEAIIAGALAKKDTAVPVVVERMVDGKKVELTYMLTPKPGPSGLLDLQLNPMPTLAIASDWPAEELGKAFKAAGVEPKVAPGMQVVRVGGQAVTDHAEYARLIAAARGKPVDVDFRDEQTGRGATVQIAARPRLTYEAPTSESAAGTRHVLGLVPATVIESISPGLPAEEAGLKVGDVVVKVGAASWPAGLKGVSAAVKAADGAPVQVVVLRDGKEMTFEIQPRKGLLGIYPVDSDEQAIIRDVLPSSPLAEMRLPKGSRLVGVAGKEVKSLRDAQLVLTELAEKNPDGFEVVVAVLPNIGNETKPVTRTVRVGAGDASALAHLAWDPTLSPRVFTIETITIKGEHLGDSMALGLRKAHKSMLQVYLTILRVVQTSVHPSQFQGPVGIAHTGTRIARQGWTYLLFFFGLISVNLAVVNFLPIPVVDGGHMVFLLIEKIKGSPVAPKVQQAALFAGLAMLLCLFLYVTYNDILRLFA